MLVMKFIIHKLIYFCGGLEKKRKNEKYTSIINKKPAYMEKLIFLVLIGSPHTDQQLLQDWSILQQGGEGLVC